MGMRLLLAALAVLVASGCGGPATVSGRVTVDGEPIQKGSISFISPDGKNAGAAIVDGTYSIETEPGSKKVEIRGTKVVGQRPTYPGDPNSPKTDVVEEIVPKKYNSETTLTFEVESGSNTKDFELTSEGK